MSGNQNFDKSTAKHIAGGKGESQTSNQAPKPGDKTQQFDKAKLSTVAGGKGESATGNTAPKPGDKTQSFDKAKLSTVAGGFGLNEQKVNAEAKPLAAKVSAEAIKAQK